MVPTKFTKFVNVYELDETGAVKLKATGEKVVREGLGMFTFRATTVRDEIDIGVARARLLQGMKSSQIDEDVAIMADAMARLKIVCEEVPPGWDWDKIGDARKLWAVYKEYNEGPDEEVAASKDDEDVRGEAEQPKRAAGKAA